jgi:branched-chain amino acid transport system substrate-binding protein
MTSWITSLFLAFAGLQAALAQEAPILVGATVSKTGAQASLADGYGKALLLWQDEVNATGGLLGRKVELRLLDDASQAGRAGALYGELIRQHQADLLIGPYGSAATLLAAAEAERARRVMINGAGPARAVHRRAPKFVFQSVAPYSAYGAGVVELAKAAGCGSVFIAARGDGAAAEMAAGALEASQRRGFDIKTVETYPGATIDFVPMAANFIAAGTQAWIAFGEARDAADMAIAFKLHRTAPGLFFAAAAAQPRFVELTGQAAERSFGLLRYDPRFATPSNAKFVLAFSSKWSAKPAAAAAEGYAAATVMAEAVRRAGSLDQDRLREALARLETGTVLGSYKVNPANGEQVGIQPAVGQILGGRTEIVWPPAWQTAEASIKCH